MKQRLFRCAKTPSCSPSRTKYLQRSERQKTTELRCVRKRTEPEFVCFYSLLQQESQTVSRLNLTGNLKNLVIQIPEICFAPCAYLQSDGIERDMAKRLVAWPKAIVTSKLLNDPFASI